MNNERGSNKIEGHIISHKKLSKIPLDESKNEIFTSKKYFYHLIIHMESWILKVKKLYFVGPNEYS